MYIGIGTVVVIVIIVLVILMLRRRLCCAVGNNGHYATWPAVSDRSAAATRATGTGRGAPS